MIIDKIKTYIKKLRSIGVYVNVKEAPTSFYSYNYRPKYDKDLYVEPEDIDNSVCILIQGNLIHKDNFTYETVKYYRRKYPNCVLIVSTWDNESKEAICEIEKAGAVVIVNKTLEHDKWGHGSLNLQKNTTLPGILEAKRRGCMYLCKTRTDFRMYGKNNIKFMLELLDSFSVTLECNARKRIICCSNCSFSEPRLYNNSDLFLFGDILDMERLYSYPEDTRMPVKNFKFEETPESSKQRTGEIYIHTHYIESLGFDLKWTKSDSDYYRRELYIIVDDEDLDLYWNKYSLKEYWWREYTKSPMLKQVTYKEWYIDYYSNKKDENTVY